MSSEFLEQPEKKRKLDGNGIFSPHLSPENPSSTNGYSPDKTHKEPAAMNGNTLNGVKNGEESELNENLYSRQLYTLGRRAMLDMKKTRVLISGMGGLGVEIAKNVILAGVKAVTLNDVIMTSINDLSSQYYLTKEDIGKNRVKCCWGKLAELNPEVNVACHTETLSNEFLANFNVVILTDNDLATVKIVSEFCHNNSIKFILATTAGLFGQIFCDFGSEFQVFDSNGEEPLSAIVANISQDKNGLVTCLDETRHGFEDGDWVVFKEVEGMSEINGKEFQISVQGPYTFKIGDTTSFSPYVTKGLAVQVKKPKPVNFKSYNEAVKEPEILICDFAKFTTPRQLHFAFQALDQFKTANNRMPLPRNSADAKSIIELTKKIAGSEEELDESLLETFSFTAAGSICPMNGVIGGITAQEVIKACTGKYMPIYQWFYFDSVESLPSDAAHMSEKECTPIGNRYDGQISVFGRTAQAKLGALNSFIVGAGAIGCEHLKNFSMMGVSAGKGGQMTITDMDTIETSNLNRQFLFRKEDVKSEKSSVAAKAAKAFNPDLNIVSKFEKVCPETEAIFGDAFFEKLDFVANALDNVAAREYMDRKCVYYLKPLLESGTLGSKGNTQVVIPRITESYSSTRDPPENSYPICTLKNFPYEITHTLQWARELFEGMFSSPFSAAGQLSEVSGDEKQLDDAFEKLKKQPVAQCRESLLQVKKVLVEKPGSFEDCVKWARDVWLEQYHNQIAQLLHAFPADRKTTTGHDFWSPPKRCPKILDLEIKSQYHIEFVTAAALLRAENFNIKSLADIAKSKENYETSLKTVIAILDKLPKPAKFVPKDGVRIAENDAELQSMGNDTDAEGLELLVKECKTLIKSSGKNLQIRAIDFEKDDESNWHIEFITSASNCRALNYSIEIADKFKSKQIAGKIIPAIATTTAVISGLVALELYKVLNKEDNIERYKCAFINLALPYFGFSEPLPPAKNKYNEVSWTLWDRFDLSFEKFPTIKHLVDHFQSDMNLDVQMISYGVSMLYSFFQPPQKQQARLAQSVQSAIEDVTKTDIAAHVKFIVLELCCEQNEEDADVPYIRFQIRK